MVQSLPEGTVPEGVIVSEVLAQFVASTSIEDLSPEIRAKAKNSLLDYIGVCLYGTKSESADHFLGYVQRQSGPPEAAIFGSGGRTSASLAALINGTFAHATELSETFTRAVVHPGNVIIPAVAAVAEREGSSGRQVIEAIAVGYEVLIRMGLAVGVPWMMEQGFHMPSALGPFGATAATCKLLDLDEEQTANALGIAACYVPTTLLIAFKGPTIKELFEGSAASTGVMAGDLARVGITGVTDWSEHWFKAVARQHSKFALIDGLGDRWLVVSNGLHFKKRAVVAMGQPVLEAVLELIEKHRPAPERITSITVESTERVVIGGERHPKTVVGAKASVPFLAAFPFVYPDEFRDDPHMIKCLTADRLDNAEVHRLVETVNLVVDPEIDRDFEKGWPVKFAARVRIVLDDGTEHSAYSDVWPSTANMSYEEVAEKFRAVVESVLPEGHAERIVAAVDELEDVENFSTIADLVTF